MIWYGKFPDNFFLIESMFNFNILRNSNGMSTMDARSGETTTTHLSVAQTLHNYVTLMKSSHKPKMTSLQRKNVRSPVRTAQPLITSCIRVGSREKFVREKINKFIINNNNNNNNNNSSNNNNNNNRTQI
jgi:hypothetical protein